GGGHVPRDFLAGYSFVKLGRIVALCGIEHERQRVSWRRLVTPHQKIPTHRRRLLPPVRERCVASPAGPSRLITILCRIPRQSVASIRSIRVPSFPFAKRTVTSSPGFTVAASLTSLPDASCAIA